MNAFKILAIVLIAAGILGLLYGKFSFASESHNASIGPMEFSVKHMKTVNVPLWAGVVAIVVGGVLLLASTKRIQGF